MQTAQCKWVRVRVCHLRCATCVAPFALRRIQKAKFFCLTVHLVDFHIVVYQCLVFFYNYGNKKQFAFGYLIVSVKMWYVDTLVYSRLDVSAGQYVDLLCNTSVTTYTMWTYDTNDGYVDYVYWNGHVASDKTRLSVKSTRVQFHSLVIDDADVKDSGLYDCYDGEGLRKLGYELVVAGMKCACLYYYAVMNCSTRAKICKSA